MNGVARARTDGDWTSAPRAVERYVALFVARRDDFAVSDGHGSWVRARRRLAAADVTAGLAGGRSISTYSQDVDGRTHVLLIDFDIADGLTLAQQTALTMWEAGIPAYVEPSREGRAHLVVTLDGRISASAGRRFMRLALAAVGVNPPHPKVELFPASDHAPAPGEVGRCIRAPMMPNPKSGRSYPLLDPRTMTPLGESLDEIVAAIRQGPAVTVIALAGPEPKVQPRTSTNTPLHIREFNDSYGVSDVLRELWGVAQAEPGRGIRCPAHDDLHPSLSIFADDHRVLCFSPDCILNNDGHGRDAYDLFLIAPMPEVRP
jgi:hypothetical protein